MHGIVSKLAMIEHDSAKKQSFNFFRKITLRGVTYSYIFLNIKNERRIR